MVRKSVNVLILVEFRDRVSRITEAGDLKVEILNKCRKFDI